MINLTGIILGYVLMVHILMNKSRTIQLKQAPEVIVILGHCLKQGQVSELLKTRLQLGASLAKQYEQAMIVVAGGKENEMTVSESQAMKQYLIKEFGIDETRILTESESKNTIENLKFSHIFWENKVAVIISNEFHTIRIKGLLQYFKLQATVLGSQTPKYLRLKEEVREHAALIKEVVYCLGIALMKKKN